MDYFLSFLEGIITFISPCLLPMVPVYISFFAGQEGELKSNRAVIHAVGFILGFTVIFVTMGAFAGTLGRFLTKYSTIVDRIAGLVIILFGLQFMGLFKLPFFSRDIRVSRKLPRSKFLSAFLFGIIFSVGWTPCVGAFLGSALMLAASSGESIRGIFMLLCFSMGLGIPFLLSAVLIDQLKTSFDFIKRHYRAINLISGGFLVAVGLLTAFGLMGGLA